jgi:formylglycine-generating enzyme required for sulfatase activity
VRTFAALALVLAMTCCAAQAADDGNWLKARRSEFASWQKTNPDAELRVEKLKLRTASRIAGRVLGQISAPPMVHRFIGSLAELWDAPVAPRLTIIPAGEFTMGSPAREPDRSTQEGPQHRVMIDHAFAVGTYLVTRDEYAAFVAETKRPDPDGCFLTYLPGQKGETKGYNWRNPGFAQAGNEPVVCVSWEDARDYAAWLTGKTDQSYRLLSEAEWEYASRAASTTARPWGDAIGRDNTNYGADTCCSPFAAGADRWEYTSPVGSFAPNAFGLYDTLGNVWQRLDDCWNPTFDGAPADGSVWKAGDCSKRTGHGGAFDAAPAMLRSSFRGSVPDNMHYADGGFRVARDL